MKINTYPRNLIIDRYLLRNIYFFFPIIEKRETKNWVIKKKKKRKKMTVMDEHE